MRIALDLDNTLNASRESIEFFSTLTNLLAPEHRIYIITNREPGTEQAIAEELDYLGIDYSEIIITADKARFIRENKISIVFENEDEYLLDVPEEVLVFKVREDGNFDFAAKKWVGSRKTTLMMDD